MDLEDTLTGENLIFYKNIKDLKVLTANAKALITRSHAVYKNILQSHVFSRPVRGTEQHEEDIDSVRLLRGECIKCGLHHGVQDFCIVYEIVKAEENKTEGPRESASALSHSVYLDEIGEEASFAQQPAPKSPEKSHKEPAKDKVKEWENLLYRKMTQEELDYEYSKVCDMYGAASGRKFLLARSMAREPDKVKPLFTAKTHRDESNGNRHRNKGNSGITSITRNCATQKKLDLPHSCPDIPSYVRKQMTSALDWANPCESRVPKEEKMWKNSLKSKPKNETVFDTRKSTEDIVSVSPSIADQSSASTSEWCYCGLDQCECGIKPTCNPPEKKCLTVTDYHNNYLFTVREKLRQRRLLKKSKALPEANQSMALSVLDLPFDVFRKDSELMVKKAYTQHQKQLKNCIESKIGVDDANLDKNVSKIVDLTSGFTKPDDKSWDQWIESIQAAKDRLVDVDDDGGTSGDSDIPTSCTNSMSSSSTTDREIQHPQPTTRRIPFVQEPFKLVDILFNKIYARFRKSFKGSLSSGMIHPYKRFFISRNVQNLMSLTCTDFIGRELVNKLKLYIPHLKTLKPKIILRAQRLKRLERIKKNLSKTIKRRRYIEGIQLGKHYRRTKKPSKFTKDQGYIGFKAEERKLLEKPTPQRFTACDLVGDGSDVLLSRKRIYYHYRLLKALFNGSMQSEDKESLMDEGMKERLQKFKKTLKSSSQSHFATDSDTEDEDASIVKAGSVSTRRPLKRNENKLKSAAGHFPGGTRSNQNSCRLSGQLNESELSNGTYARTGKASLYKSSSKVIPTWSRSDQPEVTTRTLLSNRSSHNSFNRWDGYTIVPSLLEESLSKVSEHSSQKLSSKQINYPTRSDRTEVPMITLFSQSYMTKESAKTLSLDGHLKPFRLPTPPLSESSCGELDLDFIQHRVPPKEEAHMEKSVRIDARAREKQTENILNPQLCTHAKHGSQRMEESELTDKSSDSYVPKLLKIPPKRTFPSPASLTSYAHKGAAYHKTIKTRASIPYLSDSSSTDTEPTNPVRRNRRERLAWDHDSTRNRRIAPYLDTQPRTTNNINFPLSGEHMANYVSCRARNEKNTLTLPLPKAGPSILKKSSLPKPPSDGTISENQSKTHGIGSSPINRQSFSDSSYRTISWPSEGLVRPAKVVTERLLKATQVNPNIDLPGGTTKKHSVHSRATPDPIPSLSISLNSASRKTSGQPASQEKSSPTLQPSMDSSMVRHHISSPPDVASGSVADSNHPQRTNSLSGSSSHRFSKKVGKVANEVFRRRSLVMPTDQTEKREQQLKNKAGTKGEDIPNTQDASSTSFMGIKLKKLEAIGPTRKKCFNLDIGQGINCVNYLKENAPGADEIKKKELVDLLVTPVEVKKAPKKTTAQVEKESSMVGDAMDKVSSQQLALESTSVTGAGCSASQRKTRAYSVQQQSPLRRDSFKTLDQIYKEVHGINKNNTPKNLLENDYEYEAKKKQQLKKHKIFP